MKRVFQPTKKKTILIVDDDLYFLEALQEKGQKQGYRVESLRNPDRLLERLRAERVDCLLIDLCLPGLDGVEILREIRAEFAGDTLPIIAFANVLLGGLARAAAEISATWCFSKSEGSYDQIWAALRDLLLSPSQAAGNKVAAPIALVDGTSAGPVEPAVQGKLGIAFSADAPKILSALHLSSQALARARDDDRQVALAEMHRHCRALAGIAAPVGFKKLVQMAHALEALIIEARAKPQKITPSVVRTILESIDTLSFLFDQGGSGSAEALASPSILVVDDEVISREAICSALKRANLGVLSLEDPIAAGQLLEKERFDLIFLDVEMPGQGGLELCTSLRRTETNRETPVVFVTAHSNFVSRAQTSLSGGDDFIAKPFLAVELAVKALSWLFRKPSRDAHTGPPHLALPLPPVSVLAGPVAVTQ